MRVARSHFPFSRFYFPVFPDTFSRGRFSPLTEHKQTTSDARVDFSFPPLFTGGFFYYFHRALFSSLFYQLMGIFYGDKLSAHRESPRTILRAWFGDVTLEAPPPSAVEVRESGVGLFCGMCRHAIVCR